MGRFVFLLVALVAVISAGRVDAQQCIGGVGARDACRKTIDLVNFLAPEYAGALAGGNPMIGQGGTLGGLGHFTAALRSTRVIGALPQIGDQGFATGGEARSSYSSASALVPALSVDVAFGLYRGFEVGAMHMGGVDALLSATYMSELSHSSLDVALEGSNTNFGFGLRIGVVEETPTLPGIAFTYVKRDMPRFVVNGVTTQGSGAATAPGTITASSVLVTATSLRLIAGKRFGMVDLTVGAGQDMYKSAANVSAVVNASAPIGSQTATGTAAMDMTRLNIFADATYNLNVFKFVGELGTSTGGSAPDALNTFGSAANSARTYFTLSIRIGF